MGLYFSTLDGREVLVRRLKKDDNENLVKFYNSLSDVSKAMFRPHSFDELETKEIAENADNTISYLAFCNDEPCAYFFLWEINEKVPVLGIGIADNFQNQKLGHKFLNILISDAKKLGKEGIKLTTRTTNKRAFYLYKKLGFLYQGDVFNTYFDGSQAEEYGLYLPLK